MIEARKELKVSFDIHTIDNLGVKLYSTIPPMIAELVSNAWDADANNVYIYFGDEQKTIKIVDDGKGMSFDELNEQFLRVGRNRRVDLDTDVTESGRKILGKRGLGKLSMFGIGKKITVTTVQSGIENSFVMDYDEIKQYAHTEYKPTILKYMAPTDEPNGTSILIEQIKKKSPFEAARIRSSLLSRFHIFSDTFVIHINDDPELEIHSSQPEPHQYQFKWSFPENYAEYLNKSDDDQTLLAFAETKGIVGTIYTSDTPLNLDRRGVVLFSRGKLVQENTPFNSRANDNFFQYMTGIFDVDFIDDDKEVDNCSTDRKSLAWDNYDSDELEILRSLLERVVSITQSLWRRQRKDLKKDQIKERGRDIEEWLLQLTSLERPLAKKLVDAILDNDDISEGIAVDYINSIQAMYGFEGFKQFAAKLDTLDQLGKEDAIKLLTDWEEIEAKEYAKISQGRISTIEQFEKYIRENASERDVIQKFLEEFPWLLDPKMSKFEREVTYTAILKRTFKDDKLPESNRRIDFLCTDSNGTIHVIELKRPNIKLTTKELQQIAEYIEFLRKQYPGSIDHIKGFLISDNMTFENGAETIRKALETQDIYVKSYSDLLADARRYNQQLYYSYEEILEGKNKLKQIAGEIVQT